MQAPAPSPHLQPQRWGPRDVGLGALLGLSAFGLTTLAFTSIASAFDRRFDVTGADADIVTIKIGFGTTFVYEILLLMAALLVTRLGPRAVIQAVGLDRDPRPHVWRPVVAVLAAYAGVVLYAGIMRAAGADALVPESTVPDAVTSDHAALAMAGLLATVAAPVVEESFFRGLMFTGLLRWGFWPAAAVSAAAFTVAHLDPGSVIPFFFVGLGLAWLYWLRGSLWDSVIFHFLFNFTSFVLLATRG